MFGDEARVQCHRGFKLIGGSSIIKCGPSQKFLNVPKCEGKLQMILNRVLHHCDEYSYFDFFLLYELFPFIKSNNHFLQMLTSVLLVNAIQPPPTALTLAEVSIVGVAPAFLLI